MNFEETLKRAGIKKADLARSLGLSRNTVSSWGDEPPRYALAFLELLIAYNRIAP